MFSARWLIPVGVLLLSLFACSGGVEVTAPPGTLPCAFKDPESAARKVIEYLDKSQWDLQYAALIPEHKALCSLEAYIAMPRGADEGGRLRVKDVEEILILQEYDGFQNVTRVSLALEFELGGETVELAHTLHLIKSEGFYWTGLSDDQLEECRQATFGIS